MTRTNYVFIVDDDPSARSGLTRLLRTAGHDVRNFTTANEFLDSLDPEMTGCLVLDIRMPGVSVEDLQAELEARGAHLPIIVITADDDPEARRKAQNIKAVGFFRKPVDGTALLDAIKWVLEQDEGE